MPSFRKKPVVIDAQRYTSHNCRVLEKWSKGAVVTSPVLEPTSDNPRGEYVQISTLEGVMTAIPGDWIIRGVKGEFYPCRNDIFEMTYERAEPAAHDGERGPCVEQDDEGRPYQCGAFVCGDSRWECVRESDHEGEHDWQIQHHAQSDGDVEALLYDAFEEGWFDNHGDLSAAWAERGPGLLSALRTRTPQDDVEGRYNELLYAVASKFPGESRHETALRYIRQAEHRDCGGPCAAVAPVSEEGE